MIDSTEGTPNPGGLSYIDGARPVLTAVFRDNPELLPHLKRLLTETS
ncbi:MAG TPA: hypothetical protein VGT42_06815 [Gammaproteobacteria bacterium]|nr:hypothetical protein [Gammaproteobacteria bacterium]